MSIDAVVFPGKPIGDLGTSIDIRSSDLGTKEKNKKVPRRSLVP